MARTALYYKIDQPIKEIPAEDLRALLSGANKAELLRSIALNEKEFLTVTEPRSLRGFWYATVKPVLSKLGLLSSLDAGTIDSWDSELSRTLGTMVKGGVLTYRDLMIEDTSRARDVAGERYKHVSVETYGYQVSDGDFPNVILCTEKDTAVPIVRQVASLVGCSWMSGGGQSALSATEPMLRSIPERFRRNLLVLSITDHDPSGWIIAETFTNQIRTFAGPLGIESVIGDRLGIHPHQLTAEEIRSNAYTPKPKGIERWVAEGGGIDGEPLGLELDAYSPRRLREVLVDGLRDYITPRHDYMRRSYIRKAVLEAIGPRIDEIVQNISDRELEAVRVEPFDIWQIAIDGYSTLPLDELCTTERMEQIKRDAIAAVTEPKE